MSAERATKRRKLDTLDSEPDNSTPSSRKPSVLTTYSKKRTPGAQKQAIAPETSAQPNSLERTPSALEAWQEAKAKRQALRTKTIPVPDVYDDIEGAHGKQSIKKSSSSKKKPAKDALRNQRTDSSDLQAHSTPRKGAATLGFFKQFHTPKKSLEAVGEREASGSVNGSNGGRTIGVEQDTQAGAEKASAENEEQSNESILVQPGRRVPHSVAERDDGSGKQGTSSVGRKKTFEDEIREVEEAARKEAEQEEKGETATAPSLRRRTPVRPATQVDGALRQVSRRGPTTASPLKPKSVKKRSVSRAEHAEPQLEGVPDTEIHDAMQKDTVEGDGTTVRAPSPKPTLALSRQDSTVTVAKVQKTARHIQDTPSHVFQPAELGLIQDILLMKLTGKRPTPLVNLDDEYAKVSQLINQTIEAGESNSMLLIGARGSGKTAMVNRILREQSAQHGADYHVVRLNGFIHTDDKVALREIWRQLGREARLEDEENTARNYADTLTTLLALLSHSAETGQSDADQVTKSVIFILDEFELFASHPRQTLLYNLFDIAQSRKAPIAVLGLTTRIDVAESLEKRVKSRFSHRYVHLSLAKSFAAFEEICRASMSIRPSELSVEEKAALSRHSIGDSTAATQAWNSLVEQMLSTDSLANYLRQIYYTTKAIPDFMSGMLLPLATLPTDMPLESATILEHLASSLVPSLRGPDSKLDLLPSLSTLQLALVICAARLQAIHNTDILSFALVYEEYKILVSKAKLQASASGALAQGAGGRISSKDVAKGAWEDLMECGLVMEDGRGGGRVDVGLEEIGMSGVDLGQWARWCREI